MKILKEKIAFNDDIHIGEVFHHRKGYDVEIKDIYILGSLEPAITYKRLDTNREVTIEGNSKVSMFMDFIKREDTDFYSKKGITTDEV